MYAASIKADNPELVMRCFSQEERSIQGRASYEIRKSGGKAVFDIKADDSVALRTVLNSITKLLTVIEKTGGIR
jgi:tRNA threonylcarbamoyladenosine modification (KEOPS) complex  Pcc1 subunit